MLHTAHRKPQQYCSQTRNPPAEFITLCRLMEIKINLRQTPGYKPSGALTEQHGGGLYR